MPKGLRENLLPVNIDLELAVLAFFKLDVFAELVANVGRRPGSLNAGYSIPATSDLDCH